MFLDRDVQTTFWVENFQMSYFCESGIIHDVFFKILLFIFMGENRAGLSVLSLSNV